MKKTILVIGLAMALALLLAPAALADNGPHGGYTATNTPDGCAACHRTHTAQNDMLLTTNDEFDLCVTCHGSSAAGAQTNVIDGVYAGDAGDAGGEGIIGAGLKAGGFMNALMNTDFSAGPTSKPVTSKHSPDGTAGTVWGFGDFSMTANEGHADFPLHCSNCHNPHGNSGPNGEATYRILRASVHAPLPTPTNPVPGSAFVADDAGAKTYSIAAANESTPGNYFDQSYKVGTSTARAVSISNFCGACHSRHVALNRNERPDAVFKVSHTSGSGSINCMTCHVAHGSSAAASDLSTSAGLSGGGAMLRLDDRGVCANCHVSGTHFGNLYPNVTGVSPTPVAVGGTLTINGNNFGTLGGRVRIYTGTAGVGSSGALTYVAQVDAATWTNNQVTVAVPSLAAGQYCVAVMPNGLRDGTGSSSSRQSPTQPVAPSTATPWVITVQ